VSVANNACWAIGEVAVKVLFWVLIFSSSWVSPITPLSVGILSADQSAFWCRFVVYKCLAGQARYFSDCHDCHLMSGSHSLQ
jgi:hypothetical protein